MKAHLNGIDVHYELMGEGPDVLFLNGTGSTIENSRPLLELFAARLRVLVADQRGLGQTAVPDGPYRMADYATDALALLDHVGWARCAMVGISFGGMVAQEVAVRSPDRVERLALLCTSAGGEGGSSYPLHELASRSPEEQAAIGVTVLDTRFTTEWLDDHPSDRRLVQTIAARRAGPMSETARRGMAEQIEARRHHDVYDRLDRIACPTFIACGAFDGIAPPENSRAIAARIADSQVHEFEGGHVFFLQDPDAFPAVVDFLADT